MRSTSAALRLIALSAVAALTAIACGSGGDTDVTVVEETTPTTVPTTTVPTTTVPTTTTTIMLPEPTPPVAPDGMELVWSDEFDGDAVDRNNWTYDIGGWGWGNGEAQYYTDRTENSRTQNGLLVIELRQEEYEGSFYTSARLKSQDLQEFQYGRIEARIKVPEGRGTWPAFWMLGAGFAQEAEDPNLRWPIVGEIDIMEYTGKEPDLILGTIHGPGYAGAGGKSTWFRQEFDVFEDWHTYAIEWDETGIRWFFDDQLYAEVGPDNIGRREWVFDKPFFLILNLALGGSLGGMIDPELQFPLYYYVDYVRVYQDAVDGGLVEG